MRRTVLLLALMAAGLAVARSARAQAPRQVGSWRPVVDPIAGWHAFGPVMFSFSVVAGFGTGSLDIPEPGTNFVLLALEPGIRGGRASVAFAHWWGFEGGLVVRATGLRFWKGSPRRSYLGGELQYVISLLPVGVRFGAFKPIGDEARPGKVLWLADLSVMY